MEAAGKHESNPHAAENRGISTCSQICARLKLDLNVFRLLQEPNLNLLLLYCIYNVM